jgi:hypothetical protein
MFMVLLKMGTTREFVDMVRLFMDAKGTIYLNGSITKTFEIKKGVQ